MDLDGWADLFFFFYLLKNEQERDIEHEKVPPEMSIVPTAGKQVSSPLYDMAAPLPPRDTIVTLL